MLFAIFMYGLLGFVLSAYGITLWDTPTDFIVFLLIVMLIDFNARQQALQRFKQLVERVEDRLK